MQNMDAGTDGVSNDDSVLLIEDLMEDVSIDGMCGVY